MNMNRKRTHNFTIDEGNNNEEEGANNPTSSTSRERTMEERSRSIIRRQSDLKELKITAYEAQVKKLEVDLIYAKKEAEMQKKLMEQKHAQEMANQMQQAGADLANNELDIGIGTEQHNNELDLLKEGMKEMAQKMEEIDQKNQQKFEEIDKKMDEIYQKRTQEVDKIDQQMAQKMDEIGQKNQQKFEEIDKKMARLKDKLKLKSKINWNQMEPALLWDHLGKGKILINPTHNRWNETRTSAATTLSENGLNAANNSIDEWQFVYALLPFEIAEQLHHSKNRFPGTTIYYYEVEITTQLASSDPDCSVCIGVSNRKIADGKMLGGTPNCYAIPCGLYLSDCLLSGNCHDFEGPIAEWKGEGDVIGCGIMLSPDAEKQLAIFFTFNGDLMGGKPIPIRPSRNCHRLFPTVDMKNVSLVANFGDDLVANPFKFDVQKCRELVFE